MLHTSCTIFTDGSSRGNPGPGGFGAAVILPSQNGNNDLGFMIYELGGRENHTTNNRMELVAAIKALGFLKGLTLHREKGQTFKAIVYSDSSYLINGITKWVHGWQKNGWKTKEKKDVENKDLWEALAKLTQNPVKALRSHGAGKNAEQTRKEIEWKLVEGHAGVAGNMRCDEIATAFADGEPPKLYSGVLKNYSIKNVLDVPQSPPRTDLESGERSVLGRRKKQSRSRAAAYSYVSMVDGVAQTHKTWAECEKRVKGKRGARYKKVFSANEEHALIVQWRT